MNETTGHSINNILKYGKNVAYFSEQLKRLDIYYDPCESLRNFKGFSPEN